MAIYARSDRGLEGLVHHGQGGAHITSGRSFSAINVAKRVHLRHDREPYSRPSNDSKIERTPPGRWSLLAFSAESVFDGRHFQVADGYAHLEMKGVRRRGFS